MRGGQAAIGESVKVAWADQGYTGEAAKQEAREAGIDLHVVNCPERKGLRAAPQALGGGAQFWLDARFRRLSWGFERMPEVLAGLNFVGFCILMLPKAALLLETGASS